MTSNAVRSVSMTDRGVTWTLTVDAPYGALQLDGEHDLDEEQVNHLAKTMLVMLHPGAYVTWDEAMAEEKEAS